MNRFIGFPVVVSHGAVGHLVTVFDGRWKNTRTKLKYKPDRLWILFTVPNKYGEEIECAVNSSHVQCLEDIQSIRLSLHNLAVRNSHQLIPLLRPKLAKRLKTSFRYSLKFQPVNLGLDPQSEVLVLMSSCSFRSIESPDSSMIRGLLSRWSQVESNQLNLRTAFLFGIDIPEKVSNFYEFVEPHLSASSFEVDRMGFVRSLDT